MTDNRNNKTVVSPDHICASGQNDQSFMILMNVIEQGFSSKYSFTELEMYAIDLAQIGA